MNRRYLLVLLAGLVAVGAPVHAEDPVKSKDGSTHVSAAQAKVLIGKAAADGGEKLIVLDIRTAKEFATGHLKGAKNIDFQNAGFKDAIAKLDRQKRYLVHCRSGGRSSASLPVLKSLGFKHVFHLDGGMLGWEKAGNAVVRP